MSETYKTDVSKQVLRLFDLWSLSHSQQLAFLGLSQSDDSALTHDREGQVLDHDPDIMKRIDGLLSIHKSLRLLFPGNADLCYAWISQPNLAFSGQSPAAVIEEKGLTGIHLVRNYLDQKLNE